MAEYIKRTDVMKICEYYSEHCFCSSDARGQDIADRIFDDVVEIPTADVVEVVRCKKCEYWSTYSDISTQHDGRTDGHCEKLIEFHCTDSNMTQAEHYCGYGDRKQQK